MALRDELVAERGRIKTEIEARVGPLQKRLDLIEELLATKPTSRDDRATESPNGHAGRLADKGMRESIQDVLAEIPGLKPVQVSRLMLTLGYIDDHGARTALGTRVGNEMWRMAKEKILNKDNRGGYKVVEKDKAAEARSAEDEKGVQAS